ncbi:MAG: MBOAT family protein [Clostridiales bacterium]|nr:MBOAT family protein [Clostridiales bacterium]
MVFSSLEFLCVFLPAVFILYTLIPSIRVKNALLIIASLLFYAYGEALYVFLMIGSSVLNYLCALWTSKGEAKQRKAAIVIAVILNLSILGVFKYAGFFVSSLNTVASLSIPVPQIALPIGISFFTFQALSYVIDVYRGTVEVQKNYFKVLLYICFFPQLIAGPIVKYRDINEQISGRTQTMEKTALGLRRFVCGLAKKVLIANTMGLVADAFFDNELKLLSMPGAWLGIIAYIFQIYYDFSGYSDMAIGLGHMFGFDFKENFNYPYGSSSIKEFWRRWHISLSTWFKEYLYIPLGGNRKGKGRAAVNRLIVFFCTGLWHGASWTFVLWGLWHGLFLLLEEYIPPLKKMPRILGHIYTMLVVILGFVLFRADSISFAGGYIVRMFSLKGLSDATLSLAAEQLTPWFVFILIAAVIGCAPIRPLSQKLHNAFYGTAELTKGLKTAQILLYTLAFAGLCICILRLSPGNYNPFIYFRF